VSRTLVVVYNISQMIPSAVVSFADAHRVMREIHIAVVAYGRSVGAVLKLLKGCRGWALGAYRRLLSQLAVLIESVAEFSTYI
jgi:hypothetical protein